jgi:hypothetical protein
MLELVRDFIVAALDHDAARDAVDELLFDHVVAGHLHSSVVAASLRPIVEEIIGAATPDDWQAITDELIADARELEVAATSARPKPSRLGRRLTQSLRRLVRVGRAAPVEEGVVDRRLV